MTPPSITIRFELEAEPVVVGDWLTDGEEQRLTDWLNAHEPYLRVLTSALELSGQGLGK